MKTLFTLLALLSVSSFTYSMHDVTNQPGTPKKQVRSATHHCQVTPNARTLHVTVTPNEQSSVFLEEYTKQHLLAHPYETLILDKRVTDAHPHWLRYHTQCERTQNPHVTQVTPEKTKLDHALTLELIADAIINGHAYTHINDTGEVLFEIIADITIEYEQIENTDHLTHHGCIILTFNNNSKIFHACIHAQPSRRYNRVPAHGYGSLNKYGQIVFISRPAHQDPIPEQNYLAPAPLTQVPSQFVPSVQASPNYSPNTGGSPMHISPSSLLGESPMAWTTPPSALLPVSPQVYTEVPYPDPNL